MMRRIVAVTLAAAVFACGTPPKDASGDGSGSSEPTPPPPATRHHSYVPATLRPQDAKQLIVFGDSISAGYGAADKKDDYVNLLDANDDAKWPAEATTSLDAHFKKTVEVANFSVPGAQTKDLAGQFASFQAAQTGPVSGHSIVTITIGGNDLQGLIAFGGDPTGPALDTAIQNIKDLVTKLQDKTIFPDGTSVYLMTVYDPSDGVGQVKNAGPENQTCFFGLQLDTFVSALDTWRTRYIQLGTDMGFGVIDALGAFHGHGFHHADTDNQYYYKADDSLWFAPDCIHPNDRGHDELRRLFFEAIDAPWYVATP